MDIKDLANSKLVSEVDYIDERLFNHITEVIRITLMRLGILLDDKLITYQRRNDNSSVLGIKVLSGDDNDIANYLFLGCMVDEFYNCDIYMHADKKCSLIASRIASMISLDAIRFFNSIEDDLKDKNLTGIDISIRIPLGDNLRIDTSKRTKGIKGLIKRIFN